MAYIATVTIAADTETTRPVTAPEPSGFIVNLFDGNGNAVDTSTSNELTHEFTNLSPGNYSVTAALYDTANNVIGGQARAEFSIKDEPVDTNTVKTVSGLQIKVTNASAPTAPAPAPVVSAPVAVPATPPTAV